jgi:sec-independent protein translocase protein TatA
METLGAPELLIIGVIVILLFGVGRIAPAAGELGKAIREFRHALKDDGPSPESTSNKQE